MGGVTSEIDSDSRNILLEAAHFDPVVVARMSRRHKLSSEASRRFERGVDRVIAPYASGLAASLIMQLAGGHSTGLTGEEAPLTPESILMSVDLPARVAGMPIDADTAVESLRAVGCDVKIAGESLAALALAIYGMIAGGVLERSFAKRGEILMSSVLSLSCRYQSIK